MSGSSWILQPPDHDVQLAPSWVSSFKTRNSFQILYSCIFTFILSAWTMLHPGIPTHIQRKASWAGARLLLQRLQLAIVGLLLPEFMLLMAFLEYIRARQTRTIFSEFEERYPRPNSQGMQVDPKPKGTENITGTPQNTDPEAGNQKISRWKKILQFFYPEKLERGYYACMGGFELHGDTAVQPNDVHSLPPNVVAVLIALGIAPDISTEEINDKSKAERFTKLIACLQAMWMVIQVLTRYSVGLPITLLEFNAVMHIVCALVAYLVWFRKPKDINIPTPVKQGDAMGLSWQIRYLLSISDIHDTSKNPFPDKFLRPTVILQYTREREGKEGGGQWSVTNTIANPNNPQHVHLWKDSETMGQNLTPWEVGGISIVDPPSVQVPGETNPPMAVAQDEKPAVSTTETTLDTDAKNQLTEVISTLVGTVAPETIPDPPEILITFTRAMKVNHEWAKFVVDYCLDDKQTVGPTKLHWAQYCEVTKRSAVLAQPLGDWAWLFSPTKENFERAIQNPMTIYSGVTWIFLSAVYGAVHLLPWNSYFPTLLERYMWRISGLTIIGGAPVFFLMSLIAIEITKHSDVFTKLAVPPQLQKFFNNNSRQGGVKVLCSLLIILLLPVFIAWAFALVIFFCALAIGIICALFGIIFLSFCARLYMIAEGFASLRSLPSAAYDNINWLDIFPHF